MRHLDVQLAAAGWRAEDVYAILCDFERYPDHAVAVRTVRVKPAANGDVLSSWEVMFRTGVLRWTEEDHFDPVRHRIEFRQTEGDIEHFAGEWTVDDDGSGNSLIRFSADFDLGIPTLAGILEPIAERALRDNIRAIVCGLLGTSAQSAAPAD